jgi:hypothetical protein
LKVLKALGFGAAYDCGGQLKACAARHLVVLRYQRFFCRMSAEFNISSSKYILVRHSGANSHPIKNPASRVFISAENQFVR